MVPPPPGVTGGAAGTSDLHHDIAQDIGQQVEKMILDTKHQSENKVNKEIQKIKAKMEAMSEKIKMVQDRVSRLEPAHGGLLKARLVLTLETLLGQRGFSASRANLTRRPPCHATATALTPPPHNAGSPGAARGAFQVAKKPAMPRFGAARGVTSWSPLKAFSPLVFRSDGMIALVTIGALVHFIPQDLIYVGIMGTIWHNNRKSVSPSTKASDPEAAIEKFKEKKGLEDVDVRKGRTWTVTLK